MDHVMGHAVKREDSFVGYNSAGIPADEPPQPTYYWNEMEQMFADGGYDISTFAWDGK